MSGATPILATAPDAVGLGHASRLARRILWRNGEGIAGPATSTGERAIPEETPVAFAYQGTSYAVMMATPADLQDFAVGFSLTEGLVTTPEEIEAIDIVPSEDGIVLRISISTPRANAFWERRRHLAGPSGCGLCGIESLAQAMRQARPVGDNVVDHAGRIDGDALAAAVATLPRFQLLNHETRAVHAAAFWHPRDGMMALREDIGRHNALDKLAGTLARRGIDPRDGAVLLTSRVSVEMVQKAAAIGARLVVAVSAPTALAVRVAEKAGITLAAVARSDGFEIFSHAERLRLPEVPFSTHTGGNLPVRGFGRRATTGLSGTPSPTAVAVSSMARR
jgi:FdhD protein